jgi:UDP-GlcNAc:undecaprenyl-phosphate GlcNAc-1-phosphate transferase
MIDMPEQLLVATFAGAAAVTSVLTPAVAALARGLGVLDLPGGRRIHKNPVPRIGGIAVFGGLAVGALVYGYSFGWEQFRWVHNELLAFLLPCLLVFGVGLVDDVRGLGPTVKLLGQAVAATFLIQAGYVVDDLANPFGAPISLGPAAFPLTLLWFVAVTNAFNLIDGIDGLLTTVAVAALLGCAAIAVHGERQAIAILSLALAGALIGFLPWNWHPARVFLGDSGSLVIGLAIAALSIKVCRNPITPVAPNGTLAFHAPLLLCALPLVETTLTVARRFVSGRPFFVGDRSHIHHVLLSKGLAVPRATVSLAAIAFLFSATAVLSRSWRKEVVLGWLIVLFAAAIGGLRWLGYVELQVVLDRVRRLLTRSRRTELPLALALANSGEHLRVASRLAEVRSTLRTLLDGARLEYLGVELDPDLQATIGEPPEVEPAPADVQVLVSVTAARMLLGIARPQDAVTDVPRTLIVFSLPLPLFEGRWARLLCVHAHVPGGVVPNEPDLRNYLAGPLADALRRLTMSQVEHHA